MQYGVVERGCYLYRFCDKRDLRNALNDVQRMPCGRRKEKHSKMKEQNIKNTCICIVFTNDHRGQHG